MGGDRPSSDVFRLPFTGTYRLARAHRRRLLGASGRAGHLCQGGRSVPAEPWPAGVRSRLRWAARREFRARRTGFPLAGSGWLRARYLAAPRRERSPRAVAAARPRAQLLIWRGVYPAMRAKAAWLTSARASRAANSVCRSALTAPWIEFTSILRSVGNAPLGDDLGAIRPIIARSVFSLLASRRRGVGGCRCHG